MTEFKLASILIQRLKTDWLFHYETFCHEVRDLYLITLYNTDLTSQPQTIKNPQSLNKERNLEMLAFPIETDGRNTLIFFPFDCGRNSASPMFRSLMSLNYLSKLRAMSGVRGKERLHYPPDAFSPL